MSDESTQPRQLAQLLDHPREDVGIELKDWLDLGEKIVRADLAKDLLALANFGGGFVVFGFEQRPDGWHSSGQCSFDIQFYSQDSINSILQRHAEPAFECAVHHIDSSASNRHVIIEVFGGHTVPIRSKRSPDGSDLRSDTYYVRLPGPSSSPPQSGRDWDELIQRCVTNDRGRLVSEMRRLLEVIRGEPELLASIVDVGDDLQSWIQECQSRLSEKVALIENVDRRASLEQRYQLGSWTCGYVVEGATNLFPLPEFKQILREVRGYETGWPPWIELDGASNMRAYDAGGVVECWLTEARDLDFWRADPRGRMFITRRLQEDTDFGDVEPGSFFDLSLPVWRVGECILHFERLASRIGAERARFQFEWSGLQGRLLEVRSDPRRSLSIGRACQVNTARSDIEVVASSVRDGLPEIMEQVLEPLYSLFDFFVAPRELFSTTASQLRGR